MLQLAPRGEIAVPIPKLEILQLRNVKTKHFCLGLEADIRSISFDAPKCQ
jgi:hypothetical protein